MEFETAAVLALAGCFIAILGTKIGKDYFKSEERKASVTLDAAKAHTDAQHMLEIHQWKERTRRAEHARDQATHQNKKIRENYDLGYDDVELDEDANDEMKLSDLATAVYPKLPPSLAKIIDKEEFQNAIIKTVEKKPDLLNTFIDRFLPKASDQEVSSKDPPLTQTYL